MNTRKQKHLLDRYKHDCEEMRIMDNDFSDGEKNLRWTDAHTARTLINAWGCRTDAFFFLFSYDMSKCLVKRIEDIPTDELRFVFPQMNNTSSEEEQNHSFPLAWQPHYLSEADYWRKFSIVHQNMLAGNSYLANLFSAGSNTIKYCFW